MPNTFLIAESVKIGSDEGNLTLEIEDTEGNRTTAVIHNIDLDAFYDSVRAGIEPWLRERDEALRMMPAAYRNREGGGAYDLSDPKHPDHHSVHADIWDMREGK